MVETRSTGKEDDVPVGDMEEGPSDDQRLETEESLERNEMERLVENLARLKVGRKC